MYPRVKIRAILLLLVSAFVIPVSAQGINSPPSREDLIRENLERRMNTMRNADVLARRNARVGSAEFKRRYYKPKLTRELVRRLEVPAELLARHREFLRSPGTGIIRLISPKPCGKGINSRKIRRCFQYNANVRKYAASFSFRENKRVVFARSDIAIVGNSLFAGRYSVQTILVRLGNASIEAIDLNSKGLGFLSGFRPERLAKAVDRQFDRLDNGLTVANYSGGALTRTFSYSKRSFIRNKGVYALRSIAYRPTGSKPLSKDRDVIVVLKVIESDSDGSVTILWKVISEKQGLEMVLD